ncbi:UvrD-helicase domain-containing protein [Candidatus Tisiphia endosymbiont of Nedyus quadrimaculatus]|uniref:UvrD-helicase domain-containing protein n=1 Tax=Candidatus Tisiphia endosymbiont of Nedyus quadrimaculatus TaxID=3139332 RepID=UPI00345EE258
MYSILYYNNLDYSGLETKFNKVVKFLQEGDFKSAEVKKLKPTDYFRAKLDITNRVLFKPIKHKNQYCLLILEIIRNHDYNKSRFLKGGEIIEEDVEFKPLAINNIELLNGDPTATSSVHLLNKFIIFDKQQEDILHLNLPLLVIGSAGSGKTSVTLEKLKRLEGRILYTSLSSYLVHHSQKLYFSCNYSNDKQQLDFLSFKEFLETIEIPKGRQVNENIFLLWFNKQNLARSIGGGRKVFEEFMGVIAGSSVDKAYLSKEDYLNLGIKQSIFSPEQRNEIYNLFQKYTEFLDKENYYDSNIIAYTYTNLVESTYDAILVDEVQDFTNSQLSLIFKSLKDRSQFLLCGDANQIVHPNFFSWSQLKSFFYNDADLSTHNITRILASNYRNTLEVTELANRVLRFKNYRFGSIDKESHYLIESTSENHGSVSCLEATSNIIKEVNARTSRSTSYAILVLHDHYKQQAREFFNTPLIFTVQEAKGLEYENIILYNFISSEQSYTTIIKDMDRSFLDSDFKYSRMKDKSDKSLEIYKFYINSLYVAITRSICNVYIIESNPTHKFLRLLDINQIKEVNIEAKESSREEWQKEANKLIVQGKEEQAKAIEDNILQHKVIPWKIIDNQQLIQLRIAVLEQKTASKKDIIKLLNYAIIYSDSAIIRKLQDMGIKAANNIAKCVALMQDEYFSDYTYKNTSAMLQKIDQFGIDYRNEFNLTPLMAATYIGKNLSVETLISLGASVDLIDNNRRNAFMIGIARATDDIKYCTGLFPSIYEYLKPDSIIVKINNKLVKIESYKSEYFFLYLLLTKVRNITHVKDDKQIVFKAGSISNMLKNFPENVLPKRYKSQEYIRSILARNEVNSNYPYNKRLFTRVQIGVYSLNKELQIKLNDNWEDLY